MEYKLTRNRDGLELYSCNPYTLFRTLSKMEPGEYTFEALVTERAPRRWKVPQLLKDIVGTLLVSLPMAALFIYIIYQLFVG